ncbi:MAG: hypothetical protein NT010_03055 [Proteobacteria bacterium]|nr:hypothetical protein [Pseudomonadota bacterium]
MPLGESVLLPMASLIYERIRRSQSLLYRLKKWADEEKETKYLLKRLRADDFSEVVIVYDLLVSPQNYGVVFYMAMFAKYFLMRRKKINFVIIDSEFRDDWAVLNEAEKVYLIESFLELPKVLLADGAMVDIHLMSWREFTVYVEKKKTALFPFQKRVEKRKWFYPCIFNIINRLVSLEDIKFIDRFLIYHKDIVEKCNISIPEKPYITWNARYSDKWSTNRNCSEKEFIEIYESLKKLYPEHSVMLVSDRLGCEYFKSLSNKHNVRLLFSKDFSATFMGDAALILGGDYYFQLRGGGIGACVLYSKTPYGFIANIDYEGNESEWRKGKLTPWATDKQNFKKGNAGLPYDVRF